jgi:hypothetical protein
MTNIKGLVVVSVFWAGLSILFTSCAPGPTVAPILTTAATVAPADTAVPSVPAVPSIRKTPTATPVPFPVLTLTPGEFFFNIDGKQSFIFSRNVTGYQQNHYDTFLDWAKAGGSKFVRIQLDSLGMGYTRKGGVDSDWPTQWDRILDTAYADGIYVLPVFSGWFDWNAGAGYSTWKSNPLNQANGGPVQSPAELFQKGSATQTLWMDWMQTLVKRWQGRKNILAWEVFSEVNLASGPNETSGADFVNTAAAIIRSADRSGRPVTASIADTGTWPNFYGKTEIDFIEIHPYPPSAQLNRAIISEVRNSLVRYNRPVLVGESGLNADTPDSQTGKLTIAENAPLGIHHAIWASIVSGAMNGRALYWEDSYGIFFPGLGIPWMQKYDTAELPAANFVQGVDFSDFKPLKSTFTSGIWGAAVGNESTVLGWFRDATCEPPNWNRKPVLSGQTVTITVPGSVGNWRIDFYDTQTGTKIVSSAKATRKGNTVSIMLPDFTDDIAIKMYAEN